MSKATVSENEAAPIEADAPFETVMTRLEGIVEKLERGELSLEESITTFEEGIRLSRLGTKRLEEAEHRVELLLDDANAQSSSQGPNQT